MDGDPDDEHVRHRFYLALQAGGDPAVARRTWRLIAADPDQVMATSAVLTHLESLNAAEVALPREDLPALRHDLTEALGEAADPLIAARLDELELLVRSRAGLATPAEAVEASDRCQRALAAADVPVAVLEALAERGRTAGVRRTAAARLRTPVFAGFSTREPVEDGVGLYECRTAAEVPVRLHDTRFLGLTLDRATATSATLTATFRYVAQWCPAEAAATPVVVIEASGVTVHRLELEATSPVEASGDVQEFSWHRARDRFVLVTGACEVEFRAARVAVRLTA